MSRAPSLRTLLVLSHLAVLALPLAALVGTGALARDLIDERRDELARQAELIALLVEAEPADLSATLREVNSRTHTGIRVVDAHGIVVATSGPRLGEDLSGRPEIQEALAGKRGVAMRAEVPEAGSNPRKDRGDRAALRWLYTTAPLYGPHGQLRGAVLATRPVREVLDAFSDMWRDLGWGVGAAVGVTLGLSLLAGWVLSRPLSELARASRALAAGQRGQLATAGRAPVREVQMLAADLRAMAERLEARLRDTRDYAAHVSHEFKTPLTTLRGTVELLRTDTDMPPAQRDLFLENAQVDLDRLSRMVQGLLTLARAEESTRREAVDLDVLAASVAARAGVPVEGHGGQLQGDPDQLEIALGNLLENARRHGGPNVKVRLGGDADTAWFEVEDDGPGIGAANLPHLFERFFTTSAGRTGTGLGLAIVRAVAQAHGGEARVESDGRTVFRVVVPRG